MPPINQLSNSGCSEELVAKLTKAFNEVWAMLYAQVPPEDADLSRALVDLAAEGITDPKELRRRALQNMITRH